MISSKQRCLRTSDWKLVATPDVRGMRHYQLFHTPSDPNCENDLAATRPQVFAAMRAALGAWIDEHRETRIEEIFPAGEPPHP